MISIGGCLRCLAGWHQCLQIVSYPRTIWSAWRKNTLCWTKPQCQPAGCAQAAMVLWVSSERGTSARPGQSLWTDDPSLECLQESIFVSDNTGNGATWGASLVEINGEGGSWSSLRFWDYQCHSLQSKGLQMKNKKGKSRPGQGRICRIQAPFSSICLCLLIQPGLHQTPSCCLVLFSAKRVGQEKA